MYQLAPHTTPRRQEELPYGLILLAIERLEEQGVRLGRIRPLGVLREAVVPSEMSFFGVTRIEEVLCEILAKGSFDYGRIIRRDLALLGVEL